jgi:hypothetical protein
MAVPVNKYDAAAADSRIKGNVSPERKQQLETIMYKILTKSDVFGSSVGQRVVITEASIVPKAEEASRTEARVVCEVTVEEGVFFSSFVGFGRSRLSNIRHAQPRKKFARWLRCVPDRHVRISTWWALGLTKEIPTAALHSFLSPLDAALESRRLWIAYTTPPQLCEKNSNSSPFPEESC